MQKDTLLALLHQPSNLLEDHLEDLEEIIQKYPYFHLPHILVAKLLHNRQSSLASQKIRRASLYVYNRAMLKEFILNNSDKLDVEEEFNYQDQPQRNPFVDIQQEIDDFDKKMESSSIEDLEKELAAITEAYLPKDYLAEEAKILESKETEPIEQTDNQKEQNSLIDDFLNNFNKAPETIFLDEEKTEEEAIRLFEQGNTRAAIAIYEQLKLKHPEKASYYQSQIDIFSMDFGNLNLADTQVPESTEAVLDNNIDSQTTITDIQLTSETNTPEEMPLVETQDNAKQGLVETYETKPFEGEEITESQAIAYFNEGNVAKAIEIYRQLMLQNPDKKAYFASQIEILES